MKTYFQLLVTLLLVLQVLSFPTSKSFTTDLEVVEKDGSAGKVSFSLLFFCYLKSTNNELELVAFFKKKRIKKLNFIIRSHGIMMQDNKPSQWSTTGKEEKKQSTFVSITRYFNTLTIK